MTPCISLAQAATGLLLRDDQTLLIAYAEQAGGSVDTALLPARRQRPVCLRGPSEGWERAYAPRSAARAARELALWPPQRASWRHQNEAFSSSRHQECEPRLASLPLEAALADLSLDGDA